MGEQKQDVVREGWSARELAEQTPYKDLTEMKQRLRQADEQDETGATGAGGGEERANDESDSGG